MPAAHLERFFLRSMQDASIRRFVASAYWNAEKLRLKGKRVVHRVSYATMKPGPPCRYKTAMTIQLEVIHNLILYSRYL